MLPHLCQLQRTLLLHRAILLRTPPLRRLLLRAPGVLNLVIYTEGMSFLRIHVHPQNSSQGSTTICSCTATPLSTTHTYRQLLRARLLRTPPLQRLLLRAPVVVGATCLKESAFDPLFIIQNTNTRTAGVSTTLQLTCHRCCCCCCVLRLRLPLLLPLLHYATHYNYNHRCEHTLYYNHYASYYSQMHRRLPHGVSSSPTKPGITLLPEPPTSTTSVSISMPSLSSSRVKRPSSSCGCWCRCWR